MFPFIINPAQETSKLFILAMIERLDKNEFLIEPLFLQQFGFKLLNYNNKMQKYQEKPISLVLRDETGKYRVNQEALDLFSSIEGKLAIISVAGVYRTGKSFLLNTMLLNIKSGFAVGPTVNPKTKGIWVWGKPLIFKNEKDEIINVLVLDSEGLGSTEEDINHDLRLFSITLLLSSAFMYNTVGAIDQNAIDRLGLVLRLCEHLKSDSYNDFPDFYWILRDFSLALVDKNNAPLTTKAYLEHCLSNQSNDSEYRNKIRHSIKLAFESRNCYTFVRPLMNEQSLQNLDKMQLEELRPEFVEEVINFRKYIFGNLRVKSIKGREIKGPMLCELINIYVQCINSDKLPVIESGWEQLCLKELHEVLNDIQDAVAKRVKDIKQRLPRSKKELLKQQQILLEQFQQIFQKRLKNNDRAKEYFKSVEQIVAKELKGVEEDMKLKNSSQTQAFVRKEFENIEKRLKQSEFKNMGQLVKQFQIFYEYFRKKCPYKDQIQTGLELLMKKFSDSSLILFKTTHAKKDSQLEQLRSQIQRMSAEFSQKQEKLKQERNRYQDQAVKLETNLQQIRKQNDEMSRMIQQLEGKLEIAENMNNNSMEEQLSHENITLKKKIMDLDDRERQIMCQHSQEINTLRQEILLKSNSAEHSQKQRLQISEKFEELEVIYKNCQQLNEQKNNELILKLQDLRTKSSTLQKSLNIKLVEKQQQVDELQKTIELKNWEITEIYNKNSQQSSMLTDMILQQQRKSLQEKEKELLDLRQMFSSTKQSLQKKVKQLQTDLLEKEMQFKISKLSIQQQKALLCQKIEFIKKEADEKTQKNINLQEEINNYAHMISEKDDQITGLSSEIQELKSYDQMESEQIEKKIVEMGSQIEIKNAQIKAMEVQTETLTKCLQKKIEDRNFKIQEMQILLDKNEEEFKVMQKQITELKRAKEDNDKNMQEHVQTMKIENQRYLDDQKRNAELSLVQLKNFYEMEKQRLEKRLLEERKKYEYNEANSLMGLKNKYGKQLKSLTQQNNDLNAKLEDLEEELNKMQNQYEVKVAGLEQDLQTERRSYDGKFEIMRKKYEECVEDLSKAEKSHEQDRITFLKRIEGLNFQISKKQKQILQINVKKQSLQGTVAKKDSQLENMKKTMHQQIESSLKKVSETQQKYQKINEQYSRFKIQVEKENALLNQRNEFLNARLTELAKQKDSGSLKNIQKIDKNKINQLKQQLQRLKTENMSLQAKIENLRKIDKQISFQHKKQISELEKQNMIYKQKNQQYESKIVELEVKVNQKTEMFKKQLEEMRLKHNSQRIKLQNDLDTQKEKLNSTEDGNKETIFKLQMELALVTDRISNVEVQRDQNKKDLEQTEKRLQNALNQIKKQSEKQLNISQMKKNSVDKRYSNQMELMKMSSKARQEQLEETNKKLKQQVKNLKDKNEEINGKLARIQKNLNQDKNLSEQIQKLKREKQQLIMTHRNEIHKQIDEWKRKYGDLEKRNREIEKQNNNFAFILEKEKAKHNADKQDIIEKYKQMEDQLNWERKKNGDPKNRTQSSKSKRFSMTASDVIGGWH